MKTFMYLFVCLGTCVFCRAQFNVGLVNQVGGPQDDAIFAMEAIPGGFIMVGKSGAIGGDVTQNGGCSDVWAIKTNVEGEILAQNSILLEDCDYATDILELDDGYLLSATASIDLNPYMVVMKLNMDLEVDWQYVLADENTDIFSRQVIQTSDGGYLVTCSTTDSWLPAETGIIKLNADGQQTNIFWDPLTYGDVLMTSVWDGIVVVYTAANSSDTYAPRMRKYGPEGIELWSQTYESLSGYVLMAITETGDSGIMAASINNSSASVNTNINMIKFYQNGQPEYVYNNAGSGNPGKIHHLAQTATGTFWEPDLLPKTIQTTFTFSRPTSKDSLYQMRFLAEQATTRFLTHFGAMTFTLWAAPIRPMASSGPEMA